MSAKATFWAWSQKGLKSSQKLTLLCLADNHNASTEQCNPSVAFVADKTGLDRKTILRALAELESMGLLLRQKKHGTSTNFTLLTDTNLGTGFDDNPGGESKATPPKSSTKNGTGKQAGQQAKPVPKTGQVPQKEPVPNFPPTGTNFPYNRYQKRDTESKTESTTNLKQGGRAREDRFPMFLDWQPDPDTWQANVSRAGVNPDYDNVIHEFRMYWSGEPRSFTESQWQAKLLTRIRKDYQRTQIVTTNGARDRSLADDLTDRSWAGLANKKQTDDH